MTDTFIIAPTNSPAFILNSDNNLIWGFTITSNNPGGDAQDGVRIDGGYHNYLNGNTIYNLGGTGIDIQGGDHAGLVANDLGAKYNYGLHAFADCAHGNQHYGILILTTNSFLTENFAGCNQWGGIAISGTTATHNELDGNYIGLSFASQLLPNEVGGVLLLNGATQNQIGLQGYPPNIISANSVANIKIADSGTAYNTVVHNYIGLNVAGTATSASPSPYHSVYGILIEKSAAYNVIGGKLISDSNYIGGNLYGVTIQGNNTQSISNTSLNTIKGNVIGLDIHNVAVPNLYDGVQIAAAYLNFVGSTDKTERNIISGNSLGAGVMIGEGSYNDVFGNYIGLDTTGVYTRPNGTGVILGSGTMTNFVGSYNLFVTTYAPNRISGNNGDGIAVTAGASGNVIEGNQITLNRGNGLEFSGGAQGKIVGQLTYTASNYIYNNNLAGIVLGGPTVANNLIQQNAVISNQIGLLVTAGAHDNILGGSPTMAALFLMEFNLQSGIEVSDGAHDNRFSWAGAYYNKQHGIFITGTGTTNNVFSRTYMTGNTGDGLSQNSNASGNSWSKIFSTNNKGLGIDTTANIFAGNQHTGPTPMITSVVINGSIATVYGTASPTLVGISNVEVELYSVAMPKRNGYGDGGTYITSAYTDNNGNWSMSFNKSWGSCFTAFQTSTSLISSASNSSEFGLNSCRTFLPLVIRNY